MYVESKQPDCRECCNANEGVNESEVEVCDNDEWPECMPAYMHQMVRMCGRLRVGKAQPPIRGSCTRIGES